MEVIPKRLQSRGNILFQLFSEVAEVPKSVLLGGGLQNLIQHLACLVAVPEGRPARGVAPEVYAEEFPGVTPFSDKAWFSPLCGSLVANSALEGPRSLSCWIDRCHSSLVSLRAIPGL